MGGGGGEAVSALVLLSHDPQVLSFKSYFVPALGFVGTFIFYWFAQSPEYRDYLAKPIITTLYHRYQWRWLRKEQALEVILPNIPVIPVIE